MAQIRFFNSPVSIAQLRCTKMAQIQFFTTPVSIKSGGAQKWHKFDFLTVQYQLHSGGAQKWRKFNFYYSSIYSTVEVHKSDATYIFTTPVSIAQWRCTKVAQIRFFYHSSIYSIVEVHKSGAIFLPLQYPYLLRCTKVAQIFFIQNGRGVLRGEIEVECTGLRPAHSNNLR